MTGRYQRKLTLNLGLRVEYESPVTERFDRSATQFDPTVANPIAALLLPTMRGVRSRRSRFLPSRSMADSTFAGANGSREFWDSTGLFWLPRIGLAYQATRSTVVRSGYGIFYGSLGAFRTTANLAGFSQTTPIQPTQDNGQTFTATLANPFPNGLIAPLGATGGWRQTLGRILRSSRGIAKRRMRIGGLSACNRR